MPARSRERGTTDKHKSHTDKERLRTRLTKPAGQQLGVGEKPRQKRPSARARGRNLPRKPSSRRTASRKEERHHRGAKSDAAEAKAGATDKAHCAERWWRPWL